MASSLSEIVNRKHPLPVQGFVLKNTQGYFLTGTGQWIVSELSGAWVFTGEELRQFLSSAKNGPDLRHGSFRLNTTVQSSHKQANNENQQLQIRFSEYKKSYYLGSSSFLV
ncbi:MAG TPA: hypothetical protein VEA59_06280 [Patescibacteria group bacterium]|nr:hypothetical protein [Patescibacteria group bacterium]